MTKEECMKVHPELFPMHIKSQDEWDIIVAVVNQGIDAHLEAFTRSTFEDDGQCVIHPEEMHIFLRRLEENGAEEAYSLREDIIYIMCCEDN